MFHDVLSFFTQPFREDTFDFSDPNFFDTIAAIGERYFKSTRAQKMNANRGSRHFIYMNRTFFGLFNLMFDLKAKNIKITIDVKRDKNATGVEGMSASKLRDAASRDDYQGFLEGIPQGYVYSQELFDAVKEGMGMPSDEEITAYRARKT